MNINEIIRNRRAIYPNQYENGVVKKSFLKILLENANAAPTHKLTQPWFFKVYKGASKDKLSKEMVRSFESTHKSEKVTSIEKKKIEEKCKKSNCIISIFMRKDLNNIVPEWEEIAATAMAVQNMWLTCTAYNIGCYWSTPKYLNTMNDFFKLNENEKCLGFFYLGIFTHSKVKSKRRVPIETKTEWNN